MRNERRNLAQQNSLLHRFFRNENNELTLMEVPNAPLLAAMASVFLQLFFTGRASEFFGLIFFGSIFAWGWLEVSEGHSPFRKVLGGVVILSVVWMKLQGMK